MDEEREKPTFTLEDILKEFGSDGGETASEPAAGTEPAGPAPQAGEAPEAASAKPGPASETAPEEAPPSPKAAAEADMTAPTRRIPVGKAAPGGKAATAGAGRSALPWWKRRTVEHESEKVIRFPGEDRTVRGQVGRLVEKAEDYADHMFPDDAPPDPEKTRREMLLPGVDYEEEPTHAPEPRKARRVRHPKPDLPPAKLAQVYKKGLGFLRVRTLLALLAAAAQVYLMVFRDLGLPMVPRLAEDSVLLARACALGLGVSLLLGLDVAVAGLAALLRLRPEGETVLVFAAAAAIADALVLCAGGVRAGIPYCGVLAVAVFFALWGRYLKRNALRQSCRTAAAASEPYLVTLDEKTWNGRDAYVKWSGQVTGYGSQIQEPDGAQRAWHVAAPLILLFGGVFALLASVGRRRPELFLWCLSAVLTAGCGLTGFLSFPLPFSALARRLGGVGAALGGWDGLRWTGKGRGTVLTDTDLFPPGAITLNGIKLTGELTMETVISYTATLIRESGSGLRKPFGDQMRAQGGVYRRCGNVMCHEGGVTGTIGGCAVAVGSAAFMELTNVTMPQGLKVKSALFCAVDGRLQGIFALSYQLHDSIGPAVQALIANGLDPILATRDFLITPDMLRQRCKLPADRMEFPSLDRRRELSQSGQEHARELAAVLCREGLGPYAEAVVAGKRLVSATRVGTLFSLLGSCVGMLLAFYLTASAAFAALSAGTLLAFLLLWLVPCMLVSGWANRY